MNIIKHILDLVLSPEGFLCTAIALGGTMGYCKAVKDNDKRAFKNVRR